MNVVLIVEDEMIEQEFLTLAVRDELFPEDMLLSCVSGDDAIKLAKQYRPNIILMDLMLPEIDGLTVIQEIRKFLPNSCISILTAHSDFSYAQRAISLRVFDYLLKPVKPMDFKKIFHQMLKTVSSNCILTKEKPNDHIINDKRHYFIEQAIQYIQEHFREKLTLKMVASKVFVNPKYFSHIFKKEVNIAFTDYIIQLRIQYACKLLETTKYKAYRISSECGFSDPSYFNRVFYDKMGMTPQIYRKYFHALHQNNLTLKNKVNC